LTIKKLIFSPPAETIELESIGELDEIFSYINAEIAAAAHGHFK
jgi:hypothetical protein